ncbi:hypothetical protein BCR44DRAFT_38514, partial [Catenaria anguillulae PL171]
MGSRSGRNCPQGITTQPGTGEARGGSKSCRRWSTVLVECSQFKHTSHPSSYNLWARLWRNRSALSSALPLTTKGSGLQMMTPFSHVQKVCQGLMALSTFRFIPLPDAHTTSLSAKARMMAIMTPSSMPGIVGRPHRPRIPHNCYLEQLIDTPIHRTLLL